MHGILVLTISSLLTGVSALCTLPQAAMFCGKDLYCHKHLPAALLLETPYPPTPHILKGYSRPGDHLCYHDTTARGGERYFYWACAYQPKLSDINCINDYSQVHDAALTYGNWEYMEKYTGCHVDTTNNVNNGVWACIFGRP